MGLPLMPFIVINRDSNAQLDFTIELADTTDDITTTQVETSSSSSSTSTSLPFTLTRPQANKAYLILDRALAYKKRRAYSLRVKCVDLLDGLYSSSMVEVRVQPNTNFRPRFERDIYKFDVWENASVGSILGKIHAIGQVSSPNIGHVSSANEIFLLSSSSSLSESPSVVYKLVSTDLDTRQSTLGIL